MEVSSHALDQGRVAAVGFDVAVFTNLPQRSSGLSRQFQRHGEAKKRLFSDARSQDLVVNLDDAFGQALLSDVPRGVTTIGYGQVPTAVTASRVTDTVWRTRCSRMIRYAY